MPPKKKDVAPVEDTPEPEAPVQAADASQALYRDRSGPARQAESTEGASYRDTTARLAREAAGVVTPTEEP